MKTLSSDRTAITATDPEWDLARRAWNLRVDQRPALIAVPESAQEVATAVRYAADYDPARFWDPQAYARLRRVKAAVDPADRIRSNHSIPL
jgi:FAD/FMN-containing dehydrogenase